ncbi:MFS transporter [Cohnella candidum]|uniref:MFS transporter n=1 Tax=Cohnella candidum TaxID=2674991 RepID=A0A3G3K4A0_9BACL|nr:MFS transporter [Cohnella candidum]AYQ75365.1 MFS transporter [Cohnella candidum]
MFGYFKDMLRLPGGVRRFLATEALYGIGIGMYALVLNLHLLSRGLREDEIGKLASAGILIMGALAIPVSLLANRLGRKRLLVAGILFIAAGNFIYAAAVERALFYGAQAAVSIGLVLVETTEVQLLFQYCSSRKDEARAYSLMFAVFTAFSGAGTLLAGHLPGGQGGSGDYRLPLLLAGFVLLAHGIVRFLWLPGDRSAAAGKENGRPLSTSRGMRTLLADKRLWLFSLFLALLGGASSLTGSFLNVIVKFRLHWTDDKVSLLLALGGLVLFAASLLTPWVMERFGAEAAIAAAFIGNVALFALLYLRMPVPLFTVLFLLRGGGLTLLSNLADSRLMSVFADGERNLFAGMRSVFRSAGSSAATWFAGWIMAGEDYRLPFALTAAALLLGYLLFRRWIRPLVDGVTRGSEKDQRKEPSLSA